MRLWTSPFYKDKNTKIKATIDHLDHLRKVCAERDIECSLSASDVILAKYCQQNADDAYKIFSPEMISLLKTYVPHRLVRQRIAHKHEQTHRQGSCC